jgi:hypothetical protein
MTAGSKWQLFIPAELAYGEPGRGPIIGPNSVLVFELELISIQGKDLNKDQAKPPAQPPQSPAERREAERLFCLLHPYRAVSSPKTSREQSFCRFLVRWLPQEFQ